MTPYARYDESLFNAFNKGNLWSFPVDLIDPAGADDYFWHILNNGSEPIDVVGLSFASTVGGFIEVDRVTGTAGGSPTTVLPVNFKTGDQVAVENVTCVTDPDITGLTLAGVMGVVGIDTALGGRPYWFPVPIRVPTGKAVAGLWSAATGILTGSVYFQKTTEPLD